MPPAQFFMAGGVPLRLLNGRPSNKEFRRDDTEFRMGKEVCTRQPSSLQRRVTVKVSPVNLDVKVPAIVDVNHLLKIGSDRSRRRSGVADRRHVT
jgi:hypothetical protein